MLCPTLYLITKDNFSSTCEAKRNHKQFFLDPQHFCFFLKHLPNKTITTFFTSNEHNAHEFSSDF